MKGKIWKSALAMMMGATLVIPSVDTWKVQAADQTVVINEIESDDPNGGNDWVEIVNTGSESVDLSGWFVTDDKGLERLEGNKTTPLPAGTVLAPGERLVLEENLNFTFVTMPPAGGTNDDERFFCTNKLSYSNVSLEAPAHYRARCNVWRSRARTFISRRYPSCTNDWWL